VSASRQINISIFYQWEIDFTHRGHHARTREQNVDAQKLAGVHVTMSLAANGSGELRQRFMPAPKEITIALDLLSLAGRG